MIKQKTTSSKKRISRKASNAVYRVILYVKNGAFPTKEAADKAASSLRSNGITILDVSKTVNGWFFTSVVGYQAGSLALRNRVIEKLRSHAKKHGLKRSQYSIKTAVIRS